jgi:multidrug efflux pump subunit AcrB
MLTKGALKNPYAVLAICLIVIILGSVSFKKMKVDIFPDINIPVILVSTFYRGLSPTEMEGAITLRFEQQFLQASYIEHI